MNRLPFETSGQHSSGSTQVADNPRPLLERTPLNLAQPHRLFFPQHFEVKYSYPLLIWLHSDDSSEYELDGVVPSISLRNFMAVGLRGPKVSPLKARHFRWSLRRDILCVSEQSVLETVRLATEDLSVDPTRIFICGYGTGGTVAQWLALRHPESFAAAISINSTAPDVAGSLVNWKQRHQTKVLYMYGDNSTVANSGEVSQALRFAHRSCLNYQFVQFDCGDELNTSMTEHMNRFMMESIVQTAQ